jgi:hypothetical protein
MVDALDASGLISVPVAIRQNVWMARATPTCWACTSGTAASHPIQEAFSTPHRSRHPLPEHHCRVSRRHRAHRRGTHEKGGQRIQSRVLRQQCLLATLAVSLSAARSGRKHLRKILLTQWQEQIVDEYPDRLLRGLIHSDGSRDLNWVNGKSYPRYSFSNASRDIQSIFCATCDKLGVHWTQPFWKTISIARRPDVAKLDSIIGPKR